MTMPMVVPHSPDEPLVDAGPDPERFRVVTTATRDQEFTAFMESAAPQLARTAWLLCGDAHQADELVQQALTRTYLAWDTARDRDPLAYARRLLANRRIDLWRKHRREVLLSPSDLPESAHDDGTRRLADRDRLVRALATLTPKQRRIVVLRHLVGLSEREVADDLGVSLGTVKSTASRGLAHLRVVLGTDDDDPVPAAPGSPR
jgi:RNA polymerase sigma-70 factor (sigma-E family)